MVLQKPNLSVVVPVFGCRDTLKELAEQVYGTQATEQEIKFAELIVRECALVAKTLPHTPERHWVQDSVTYIPVHCEQNILKHFGVEE
jgi:hypothetical protein